ncbi:hypothetical protein, partial [Mesorhizobium sp.]|uniref:hypothetical protein n=1 Tax=Mesorhizobium sp. TaxID=1871066 RepID=UPI0025C41353
MASSSTGEARSEATQRRPEDPFRDFKAAAAVQNSVPLCPSAKVTAWQLCSCECGFVADDGV